MLLLAQISQAVLTPIIAIAVAWIAYQQWKTNHLKLKWEMFDRRMDVFRKCNEIIRIVNRDASLGKPESIEFLRYSVEVQFLFGDDVYRYVRELAEKCIDLTVASEGANGSFGPTEVAEHRQRRVELLKWIIVQSEPLADKFRPYMQFPKQA